MSRKLIGLLIIILTLLPLSGCFKTNNSPPAALLNTNLDKIEIAAEAGVPDKTLQDATLAAKAAVYFFKTQCDLELPRKVKILLVKDNASFAKALKQEKDIPFYVTNDSAQWEAKNAQAITISNGQFIVFNANNIDDSADAVFVIAHELVHAYTNQITNEKTEIPWLDEGTADVLAGQIVDLTGLRTFADWQKKILKPIKELPRQLPLSSIVTPEGFHDAMEQNGFLTYATADVAVMALVDKYSYKALIGYYKYLGNTGGLAEGAFVINFGMSLNDVQQCYDNYIANKQ